jgi:hypothetical protein
MQAQSSIAALRELICEICTIVMTQMGYAANWPDDTRQGGAVLALCFRGASAGLC